MYEAPIGVRALVIIQKLFGALAIGLSAYTLKFYCEGNSSGDEKMAAIGAGLCIICVTAPASSYKSLHAF